MGSRTVMVQITVFFFFSSRRRHTRSLCDWSSDVCSSDLAVAEDAELRALVERRFHFLRQRDVLDVELRQLEAIRGEFGADRVDGRLRDLVEIGRASCRERV